MRRLLLLSALCLAAHANADDSAVSLAIAARDQNDPARAESLWEKAVELSPTDGFLIAQKAWSQLALERIKDAKKSFAKAAEFSPDTAGVAEAQFGLGLTQYLDGDYKAAAMTFESVVEQSVYLYPVASTWLARTAERMGKPDVASLYLKHSLDQDPLHPLALDELGDLYASHKMAPEARQCFVQALSIDPDDSRAKVGLRKTAALPGGDAASGARRIVSPMLQKPTAPPASAPIHIALFSDESGEPIVLKRIHLASGVGAKLNKDGKEIAESGENEVWEAVWDDDSRVLEVRDQGHKLRYAGRDVVRLEPDEAGGSVLLRDAQLSAASAIDFGDRELRGTVELRPAASGFYLINELGSEEYLYSELGALSPNGAPAEALKAQAVVLRSGLDATKKKFAKPGFDLCDSGRCQVYLGLVQERGEATEAVIATAGQVLYSSSGPVNASIHAHCAGITEEGIVDAAELPAASSVDIASGTAPVEISTQAAHDRAELQAALSRGSEGLDRFLHADPVKELYCNASPLAPANWGRWVRTVEPREFEEAAGKPLGELRAVKVLSRTSAGRVSGLELEGSSGKWTSAGEEDLLRLLSRLGLRSSLVSFQPLYHDKRIRLVVVWGAGSGSGHGLCVAGALGQANQGRDYKEILKHYFPAAEVR